MLPVQKHPSQLVLGGLTFFFFLPSIPLLASPIREVPRSSGADPPLLPLSPDKLRRP